MKQSRQSAFAKLDLQGFDDEMPFLSGSSEYVELLHEVMTDVDSEAPEAWYQPFVDAVRNRRAAKVRKTYR